MTTTTQTAERRDTMDPQSACMDAVEAENTRAAEIARIARLCLERGITVAFVASGLYEVDREVRLQLREAARTQAELEAR